MAEKPNERGKSLMQVHTKQFQFCRQRNSFEIHLSRKVLPVLQKLKTFRLKSGRAPGLVEKDRSHAEHLVMPAMPLGEQQHCNFVSTPCCKISFPKQGSPVSLALHVVGGVGGS